MQLAIFEVLLLNCPTRSRPKKALLHMMEPMSPSQCGVFEGLGLIIATKSGYKELNSSDLLFKSGVPGIREFRYYIVYADKFSIICFPGSHECSLCYFTHRLHWCWFS